MSEHILVDREGGLLTLRLNRPDKMNALTRAMYSQMAEVLDAANADRSVRVVLITGGPECFTSGNDIKDFAAAAATGVGAEIAIDFLTAISTAKKPLIAAAEGFAVGIGTTMLAIGVVYTPIFARVARASTLSVRVEPFVSVSYTMGTGPRYILTRHILPNISGPLIVQTSLSLAFAILAEAALSFLGLGIQPPQPSLGRMIFDAQGFVTLAWWMAVFPGAAIFLIVLAFNLFGDGLRDVLDPKQRTTIEARRLQR